LYVRKKGESERSREKSHDLNPFRDREGSAINARSDDDAKTSRGMPHSSRMSSGSAIRSRITSPTATPTRSSALVLEENIPTGRFCTGKSVPAAFADSTHDRAAELCVSSTKGCGTIQVMILLVKPHEGEDYCSGMEKSIGLSF
jgi:hypothetical protein